MDTGAHLRLEAASAPCCGWCCFLMKRRRVARTDRHVCVRALLLSVVRLSSAPSDPKFHRNYSQARIIHQYTVVRGMHGK